MSLINKIIFLFFLSLSGSALASNYWSTMTCTGTDTTGKPIYLTIHSGSTVVNINGDYLQIVGRTRNGQGIVTENFVATNGTVVYDSIVPTSNVTLNIYQFNAVTEALLAQARLFCRFNANVSSKLNAFGQPIFAGIKTDKTNSKLSGFLRSTNNK